MMKLKTKSSCYINHFIYQYYMLVNDGTKKQSHHVISIILYINTTCRFMMKLKTKSSCYINHFIYQYYMLVNDGTKKQSHHVISIILYINTTCWLMMELKNKVIMLYPSFYISILHEGS